MGVRPDSQHDLEQESGQSVLEFLLMLPLLIGLVLILVRVNSAIQVSIVNQQYARSHALWLAFNSATFPGLALRSNFLLPRQDNQMVIGVSANPPPTKGQYTPQAATAYIARKKGFEHLNEGDKETSERANVRVRDSVTICTQINVVKAQSGYVPLLPADGPYNLSEDPHQFDYCRSNQQYTVDAQEVGT